MMLSTLEQLQTACHEQMQQFRAGKAVTQTSCDELLRRAAAFDEAALALLLATVQPLIQARCPATVRQRQECDDLVQLVSQRLLVKFRNQATPYIATTFAAFRSYLNTTITNTAINLTSRTQVDSSLEDEIASGHAPTQPSAANQVEAWLRLERCLALLPDPMAREVFRRRFVLQEDVDTTLRALQRQGHTVTKAEVYRLAERSIALLSRLPEVRAMFEAEAGNDR